MEPHEGGDQYDVCDNTFHGPFQAQGVQNNYFHAAPRTRPGAQGRWPRRAAWASALAVLGAAGGAYAVYAMGSTDSAHRRPTPATEGMSSGIAVTRPTNPGTAALPSDVQIQGARSSEGCTGVNYYAETAGAYRARRVTEGTELGSGVVDITSQTSSSEAVLLMGMRVHVLQRKAPPTTGIVVRDGQCGVAQAVRPFWTDLDKPSSAIVAEADPGGPGDPGHPPVTFPFKISPDDPEVFELTAKTKNCFCTFAIEIDWVVAGKAGKTILNNSGRGFFAGAAPGLLAYEGDPYGTTHLKRVPYRQLFLP